MRHRATRIGVDVGLATGAMTLPQAIAYFQKNANIGYDTARGEATRFAMDPGQAIDYLIGKTQIETLIGLVQDREGASFNQRAFHDRLLSYGTVPYSTIRYEWLGDSSWLSRSIEPLAPQAILEAMAPKITGGSLGSRKLKSPKGPNVRPTPGRVKESLFSILMNRIDGARVLDLFAGTGAIGFEAASRGAARVVSVEAQREIANAIEDAGEESRRRRRRDGLSGSRRTRALSPRGPVRHRLPRSAVRRSSTDPAVSAAARTRAVGARCAGGLRARARSGFSRTYPGIAAFAKKSTAMSRSRFWRRE